MRDNTPPRVADIEDDEVEIVHFDNDDQPDDDFEGEMEMEEVSLDELESRLRASDGRHDDAQYTFREHKGPVFSCSLHPRQLWAATGGEDDMVYVWEIDTGAILHTISEHKDTVTAVHFSHDGTFLASGDMAGTILVHKLQETTAELDGERTHGVTLRKIWEYLMGDMAWMRWHRVANVLLAGSDSGEVYVWRLPTGECKILPGEGTRCEAGELTHDGKKLFTAYGDGVLKLWDLKSCTVLQEVNLQHPLAHTETVTTVACDAEAPVYMSGGTDGKILFSSNNGPVGSVDADGPVECVAFSSSTEFKMAASGTLYGQIAIWDYAKYNLRKLCHHPEIDDGITHLKWLNEFTLLVSTLQGYVYGYDARSGTRLFTLSGHMEDIYEFCYNARDNVLLTVSEDFTAKIFKVPQLSD